MVDESKYFDFVESESFQIYKGGYVLSKREEQICAFIGWIFLKRVLYIIFSLSMGFLLGIGVVVVFLWYYVLFILICGPSNLRAYAIWPSKVYKKVRKNLFFRKLGLTAFELNIKEKTLRNDFLKELQNRYTNYVDVYITLLDESIEKSINLEVNEIEQVLISEQDFLVKSLERVGDLDFQEYLTKLMKAFDKIRDFRLLINRSKSLGVAKNELGYGITKIEDFTKDSFNKNATNSLDGVAIATNKIMTKNTIDKVVRVEEDSIIEPKNVNKISKYSTRIIKVDHEKLNKLKNKIGLLGEEIVLLNETKKLKKWNLENLLDKVKHVSKEGDGHGYDIKSINANSDEVLIEVKATITNNNSFKITANELRVLNQNKHKYFIAHVKNLSLEKLTYDLKYYSGLEVLKDFDVKPTEFKIFIR